jgi:hypothetical protein
MVEPDADMLAIQEDALLLDFVAARGDLSAFADDPLAALLGAYVADIDEGIDDLVTSEFTARGATTSTPVSAGTDRPGRSVRFLVAAGTAVALVGTSGVAAAVTGDPFMPFREAVKAVSGSHDDVPKADDGGRTGGLPDEAAEAAEVAQTVSDINQAIASGDLAEAKRLLDEVKGNPDLLDGLPPGLAQQLDDLQHTIDDGDTRPGKGNQGQGKDDHQGQGKDDHQGQGKDDHQGQGKDDQGQGKGNQGQGKDDHQGQGVDKPNDEPGPDSKANPEAPDAGAKGKGNDAGAPQSGDMSGDMSGDKATSGSGKGGSSKGRPASGSKGQQGGKPSDAPDRGKGPPK